MSVYIEDVINENEAFQRNGEGLDRG